MPRAFAEITFTESVKAAQRLHGSRDTYVGLETAPDRRDRLTEREAAFIHERDGFYQASVSETGWPYVQFRGGPTGFLRVLAADTIGYANFRGNMQYLSVGNLGVDGRVALILMDYANRRRLKIWGRARIVPVAEAPDLMADLAVPGYSAQVEHAILITVDAYDWNCPKHITPRYTVQELSTMIAPLRDKIAALEAENRALRHKLQEA